VKEEALKYLEEIVQETNKSLFVAIAKSNTMKNKNMVNSPSNTLGDFEKHTICIDSNLMKKMSYDVQGIGKEGKGIMIVS
jgi:hypothetical protein